MPLLEIRNVTRRFGELDAVHDVSLDIEAGEFFTLLGPSGCGKTTLLRLIAGFDPPDAGCILLDGLDMAQLPPEARPLHTVFQNYALFPHMTVAENIGFPLRMGKLPRATIKTRVEAALEEVQLSQMGHRYPEELSGGQRQRVAIARALIDRPRLLLLDEPLAALDLKLREQMRMELIKLQQEVGITFIYVTHDQSEALALSHRIAVMNQGKVVQIGSPDAIYESPSNRFVAGFIGTCNLLQGTVASSSAKLLEVAVDGLGAIKCAAGPQLQAGQSGVFALRPEKLRIGRNLQTGPDEHCYSGTIRHQLYLGDATQYLVDLDGGVALQALRPNSEAAGAHRLEVGQRVQVAWSLAAGRFLGE